MPRITAVDLAARLGISPAAVRRHLDQLVAEGAVISRQAPARVQRGRGRPARSYLFTDVGRERLPHQYDDLAVQALGFLQQVAGPESVSEFARRRAEAMRRTVHGPAGRRAGHRRPGPTC